MLNLPSVTVIMPIRNEVATIRNGLAAVMGQAYPQDRYEVIVVDGMSTDGTRQIIAEFMTRHPNLRIIENEERIVPTGLNAAIRQAKGGVIIRVDGHCEVAPDYILSSVRGLDRDRVDCVGGPIDTIGKTKVAQAIALAMSSPFGVGGSPFRTIKHRKMRVDTVAFPAYTRSAIQRAGLFDEELVRNQDDEYNYRLRKMGGSILLSPDVRVRYFSRSTFSSLWKQYFQYGFWKVRVLQKHPGQMALRQFVPPVFMVALIFSLVLALFTLLGKIFLALVAGSYTLANLWASLTSAWPRHWRLLPCLPLAFAVLHVSYGLGFLVGLGKFIHRWGDIHGKVPEYTPTEAGAPFPG